MTILWGIYGAGGCGRGVMPLARQQLAHQQSDDSQMIRLVFIDDTLAGTMVNGHDVMDFQSFCRMSADERRVSIALADPATRRTIADRCIAAGLSALDVVADDAVMMDDVEIGSGAILSPQVVLTSNIRIGRHFHANIASIIEHDARIGDFVTFAPGVRCNGHVHIGDGAYIGAGALIRQGTSARPLRIGAGAVVGMGAVVLADVEPGLTVVGNPARPIHR